MPANGLRVNHYDFVALKLSTSSEVPQNHDFHTFFISFAIPGLWQSQTVRDSVSFKKKTTQYSPQLQIRIS